MLRKIINNLQNARFIENVVESTSTQFKLRDCFFYYSFFAPLRFNFEYNNARYGGEIQSNLYINSSIVPRPFETIYVYLPPILYGTLHDLVLETKDDILLFLYQQPVVKSNILEYTTFSYELYLLFSANYSQLLIQNEYNIQNAYYELRALLYKNYSYELLFEQFYHNFTEIVNKIYQNQNVVGEYSALQMRLIVKDY
mgnify:CR=1 FL=1